MKTYTKMRSLRALLLALAPLPTVWSAQPATGAAPIVLEEPVMLSPFTVSTAKDYGYKATNSISGTRLDMAIKDVPLNLEVITSDFIHDIGATNLREALQYSAGLVLESQADAFIEPDFDPQSAGANDARGSTRANTGTTFKIRGFVSDQVLRDGFRRQFSTDSVNIDRVEVLRGPSALLYGVGSLGGVVNYVPKRPQQKAFGHASVTMGSHDLKRTEFDYTAPMGKNNKWRPAYRVSGAWQENEDYTDWYHRNAYTIAPSFSFRPTPTTEVLFENEFGYRNETGVGAQNIRSSLNSGATRTASWLTDTSNGVINTRTFRWTGPDTFVRGPFRNHILDVTQKIGSDLYVRLGIGESQAVTNSRQVADTAVMSQPFSLTDPRYYYVGTTVTIAGASRDLRDALTQANANGNYLGQTAAQIAALRAPGAFRGDRLYGFVANNPIQNEVIPGPPATSPTGTIRYRWSDYNKDEVRDQIRADLAYKLDLGKWGKHNFLAGVQYMKATSKESDWGPGYSYPGHTVIDQARYSYKNPTDYSPFRFGVQSDGLPDTPMVHLNNYKKKTWDLGAFGVYQGRFWQDRITLIGGLRHDRNDAVQIREYVYEQGRASDVTSRAAYSDKAPAANSPQVGLSFAISRGLSVFGVYSTGVVPNYSAYDGNGNLFSPTKAKNYEVGIKFDAFNGKVSGTISAFRIERTNVPRFLWWAPSPYASRVKGWNAAKPNTTVWWDMGPESLWYAMKNAGGVSVAKKIFPSGFATILDKIAAVPASSSNAQKVDTNALASALGGSGNPAWWSYDVQNPSTGARGIDRDAVTNAQNSNFSTGVYSPLINMGDPQVAAFVSAAKLQSGYWGGNFYYTTGQTYAFGDGGTGIGNAPDGSGASVPLADQSKGWDGQVVLSPRDNFQIVLGFSHLNRTVTSKTYQFVKAPYWPLATWYVVDGNYGTLGYNRPVSEAYGDPTDSSTYRAPIPDYAQSVDDSPKNTGSVWFRYSPKFSESLKGLKLGLGGTWESKRLWFTGFTGGGGNVAYATDSSGNRVLVQLYTKARYTVNAFAEYRFKVLGTHNAHVGINVDNVLDDQKRYGQVFAPGASYRFSAGIDF